MQTQATISGSTTQPDEWLTPQDVQRIFKWGKTRFWQLVEDNAFPVTRPKSPSGRSLRLVYVKRSDIDRFLNSGYSQDTVLTA